MSAKVIYLKPPEKQEEAPPKPKPFTKTEGLIQEVAERHGITMAEMMSHRRKAKFVNARHEAMYLLYTEHKRTYQFIARFFNNCNHTSVLHAVRRHKKILDAQKNAEAS